ncbi:hypothetical protein ES332_A10G141700v1 [Gossypium tomentosum]|uniref:Uncharacterized protein n=1 Tax=Gossypium tomentosum TaxID=34277 RepID=A0A5D2NSY0_GOSTO|nr:hypothetical protein ES332_A10G141700v1 [Gossypium tomentosum]
MVRPLYTEENKGEKTPHLLFASILTMEKKIPVTQPRGGSGASRASGGVGGDRLWWLVFFFSFFLCLGWASVMGLGWAKIRFGLVTG